tara:strand:+ start:700 stop:1002 length:303 start_codon:yes stop_codon:yes gene_type:complete
MEVQMRQFEQIQQVLGTEDVPVKLLELVAKGNKFRKPIFGGGYMNGADLLSLCLTWVAMEKESDTVSSFMDYKNYSPTVKMEPVMTPKKAVRKKKVAING